MLALVSQVELLFDPEPILRFTPHLADDASKGDVDGADANGRWGPWRKQVCRSSGRCEWRANGGKHERSIEAGSARCPARLP